MKQTSFYHFLMTMVTVLTTGIFTGCTEDLSVGRSTNSIVFDITGDGFNEKTTVTRGTKATTVSTVGVSASVYSSSSSYTTAGCGSYFYNQQVTSGLPTEFFWPTSSYKVSFFAHYPYNNAAFTVQSAANALGAPTYAYTVPSAIADQVDVMTGQNVNILGGGSSPVSLTMKHRCAAICFSVTNSRSEVISLTSISIEGVKYSGTLNEDTWILASAVNSSSSNPFTLTYGSSIAASATANVTGTTNIFLMLPQTIPAGAKLKVVVDGSEEMEAELTGAWTAGKNYNYSIDIKNNMIVVVDEDSDIENWENPIDLSMVDNAGYARSSRTTANCYLVHAAGYYKIPLVYGNSIKNGKINTVAFYPGKNGSITNGKDCFVNHNGDNIIGPWITKGGIGINTGMSLTAASAELIWQDRTELITSVSISGDYLYFTVGSFNPGNALIAVKDGSGYIMWSWHVWATEDDLSNTTVISTGSHNYTVAPVNVGWVPTGGDGKQGYCPYYQWGRKDPFIPSTGSENTNHVVYRINNDSMDGITYYASSTTTIADNIKNPKVFYYNSSTKGPCNTTYYNMWDAQNTTTGNVITSTQKTVYDPCPPGFCVPTGNLYYYICNGSSRTMSTWDSTNMGAIWNSGITGDELWFPALGCRQNTSGSIAAVNTGGYYWSATPGSTNYGGRIKFDQSSFAWGNNGRAGGFSIRPVVEE